MAELVALSHARHQQMGSRPMLKRWCIALWMQPRPACTTCDAGAARSWLALFTRGNLGA